MSLKDVQPSNVEHGKKGIPHPLNPGSEQATEERMADNLQECVPKAGEEGVKKVGME